MRKLYKTLPAERSESLIPYWGGGDGTGRDCSSCDSGPGCATSEDGQNGTDDPTVDASNSSSNNLPS
jgi:hypothetical protein